MTILVIDDSRFMQKALDKALREAGYTTILAGDGERGWSAALQSAPDLILLDIMLPGLPGTSVLRRLKNNPLTADIPIVVLTSLDRLDGAKLEQEGAHDRLAKADLNLQGGSDLLIRTIKAALKESVPDLARSPH